MNLRRIRVIEGLTPRYHRLMKTEELFDAIKNDDASRVAALLDEEPELCGSVMNGITPILFATYYGHPQMARLFLERGATLSFGEACALGESEVALRMLDADPTLLGSYSSDGFPGLGLAIFFRHPKLAAELIGRGADVGAASRNAQRVAPVHAAASVGDIATMRLLLERGAKVNARQQDSFAPLHAAAGRGDQEMIALLLAHGADRTAKSDDGKTAGDIAAERGHSAVVDRLRED